MRVRSWSAWRGEEGDADGLGRLFEGVVAGGERHHERKAVAERIAGGSITLGRLLAVLAAVVLLLLLWWWLWSILAGWIAVAAVLALVVGLVLVLVGQWMRRGRGLGEGRTVALDNVVLTSRRLGLTGRPDRLVTADGTIIPEEWKSSRRVWPSHRARSACTSC